MPTFIFYRNKAKIDRFQGADLPGLESKIQQLIGSGGDDSTEDFGQGLVRHFTSTFSRIWSFFIPLFRFGHIFFPDGVECVHSEKSM